jgi:hypothetical protein
MKVMHNVSTLALLAGFGFAGAALPATAQQGQAFEKEGQVEQLDRSERQDAPAFCDNDGNGYISVTEAENCAERGYTDWIDDGEQAMSEEQFVVVFPEAADAQAIFVAADTDGDGQVTQEEWMSWHQQSFADRSQGDEVPVEDYEVWYLRGMAD